MQCWEKENSLIHWSYVYNCIGASIEWVLCWKWAENCSVVTTFIIWHEILHLHVHVLQGLDFLYQFIRNWRKAWGQGEWDRMGWISLTTGSGKNYSNRIIFFWIFIYFLIIFIFYLLWEILKKWAWPIFFQVFSRKFSMWVWLGVWFGHEYHWWPEVTKPQQHNTFKRCSYKRKWKTKLVCSVAVLVWLTLHYCSRHCSSVWESCACAGTAHLVS